MTGLRGAHCTGAGEGPPVCTRRFQETRPEAELEGNLGENRGGAPKGERAPMSARPRPKRIRVATSEAWRGPMGQSRLFGAPPPLIFFGGKSFVALVGKTRAPVRRENEIARFTSPRTRGEGVASVGREEISMSSLQEEGGNYAQTQLSRPADARTVAGVAA